MTRKKWKIAFWLSLLVFIVASCFFVPVWWEIANLAEGPLCGAFLHPFPLSLYISLVIWLGNRAFRDPERKIRVGWLIVFWSFCVPGLIFYFSYVSSAIDILGNPGKYWQSPEIGAVLGLLHIPAFFFFVLQIMCAWVAFSPKKVDQGQKQKVPVKEEHVIEDISRDEAVARMKERYRQDTEGGNRHEK